MTSTNRIVILALLLAPSAAEMGNAGALALGLNRLRGALPARAAVGLPYIFSRALHGERLPFGLSRRIQAREASPGSDHRGEYVKGCESFLLARDVIRDGIISQSDFVDMLINQCRNQGDDQGDDDDISTSNNGNKNDCPPEKGRNRLKFEHLPLGLQLEFIRGICHHGELEERITCVNELNDMWLEKNEFGFEVGAQDVERMVRVMCAKTYHEVAKMGFARSQTPTIAPSASPTPNPSSFPTKSPSPRPSRAPVGRTSPSPTRRPSWRPSRSPTNLPTNDPSMNPQSSSPTNIPARRPSWRPSRSPTNRPSSIPTNGPSMNPQFAPLAIPARRPSWRPSRSPTNRPSPIPTNYPSTNPQSASLTNTPTRRPSWRPSRSPTNHSSTIPTNDPSMNPQSAPPTILPTGSSSTRSPTAKSPTSQPSFPPRSKPSAGSPSASFPTSTPRPTSPSRSPTTRSPSFPTSLSPAILDAPMDGPSDDSVVSATYATASLSTLSPSAPTPSLSATKTPSGKPLTPALIPEGYSNSPSEMPPIVADGDGTGNVGPNPPSGEYSISRGAVIGMSLGLALSLAVACIMYAHHLHHKRPRYLQSNSEDPNHFGIAAHEPWGRSITSLPMSHMNLNYSLGSSSSSFRDYRFVNVFGPEGEPIPQFNPNTAGAVVIGSVTIGGSSSYSSGLFGNGTASQSYTSRSHSFFATGWKTRPKAVPNSESAISSKDDMSSLSSNRSSRRKNPRYRRFDRPGAPLRLDRLNHIKSRISVGSHLPNGSHFSTGTGSQTKISRNTVPMSHRRRQKLEQRVRCNKQVSFGDWRAVAYMSKFRHSSGATDAVAALRQTSFFFDTLLSPESNPSPSVSTPKSLPCQSWPNMLYSARDGSLDAGTPSILSESFFVEGSSYRAVAESASTGGDRLSADIFVPWRKEGFSLRLSDSKQSDEGSLEESSKNTPEPRRRLRLFRPAKALFVKYVRRTRAKDWFSFRHSRYQHLSKGNVVILQEDHDVLSMKSYSSQLLLPPHLEAARAEMPNLVLGTFAAAMMPIEKLEATSSEQLGWPKQPDNLITLESSPEKHAEERHLANAERPANDILLESSSSQKHYKEEELTINSIARSDHHSYGTNDAAENNEDVDIEPGAAGCPRATTTSPVTVHISSLDTNIFIEKEDSRSFCAYSQSAFDSLVPSKTSFWLESSSGSSSGSRCDSSTDSSQLDGNLVLDCSFAAAAAPLVAKPETNAASSDVIGGCAEDVSILSNCTNKFDVSSTLDDESKAVHLIGISHILSESEPSGISSSSSVFAGRGGGESSFSSCGDERAENETNIISRSSASDPEEVRFPSGEHMKVQREDGDELFEDFNSWNHCPKSPFTRVIESEAKLVSLHGGQECEKEALHDLTANDVLGDASPQNIKSFDEKAVKDVPSLDRLDMPGKADGRSVLSISLSWGSEGQSVSNSIVRKELDVSSASSIPFENTTL